MPIYEYQCQSCQHQLDALQKINDPLLTDCPACGKATLTKQVSAPRFRLKGNGWYETDFKTGDKKNLAGDAGEKKPAAESAEKPAKTPAPADKTAKKETSAKSSDAT